MSVPAAAPVARVIASHGRRVVVEDAAGARRLCLLAGRRLRAACGDRVRVEAGGAGSECRVVEVLPRDNALERPDKRGRLQTIAANLTQIVAVAAPSPPPDLYILDRYLGAAALMRARALVVLNKADLEAEAAHLRRALGEYSRIGYTVIETSAVGAGGIDALAGALRSETSILVGQSGVGKSSLLNALLPGVDAATAELSRATGEGRHKTVVAVLHHLPRGGDVVDSPGVRDYAPPPVGPVDVSRAFVEIAAAAEGCRFADCLHLREPGCRVRAAVEAGSISPRRYESYRRLARRMRIA
ncbi:MAG TPA: ribosome small subunit-dependent GTPase A [Gammaproteobacteria bacterium]|nr:ribosome small subunit-dependent GTPase A [Gammaproteobacteria bacterium]